MKKLTLFKGRATAFLVLLCLFLAQGCRKDLLQPNSNGLKNSISVAEARKYFDLHLKTSKKQEKLMSTSAVGKALTIEAMIRDKQPLWDYAYNQLLSNGQAIKIPIDFGKAYVEVTKKSKALLPLSSLSYLYMYKDSLQNIHAEWVLLKPDSAWLYGKRDSYSGSILVKDWNGKSRRVYNYVAGQVLPKISHLKQQRLSSLGKIQNIGDTELSPTEPVDQDPFYCVRISTGTCPQLSPCSSDYCDMCLAYCAKQFCAWPDGGTNDEPDLSTDDPNPTDDGEPVPYPGSTVGGGGPPPTTYPPTCESNPDYTVPDFPAPTGYNWVLPCSSSGGVPLPYDPNDPNSTPIPEESTPFFLPFHFNIEYDQEWYVTEDEFGSYIPAFIQQGVHDTDPIPEMYYRNGTAIDMTPAPAKNGLTVMNAPRNKDYFWKQLVIKRPEMFSQANRARLSLSKPLSPIIDQQWVKYNLTHRSYMGDKLIHHHDEQGFWAFAIPQKVHYKWNKILHEYRLNGKMLGLSGTLNSLVSVMQIFSVITDVKTSNPDAWINWFGQQNQAGKIYPDPLNNKYWEIMDQVIYKNAAGVATRAVVHYNVYADYIWDSDEKRYMGVIKLNECTEEVDLINKTSKEVIRKWQ